MSIQRIAGAGRRRLGHGAGASHCARAGRNVTLWNSTRANAEHLATDKRESRFLPGVKLNERASR